MRSRRYRHCPTWWARWSGSGSKTSAMDEPVIVARERSPATVLPPDIPPLLARIYAARGVTEPADLDRALAKMLAPHELHDAERAAARLAEAIVGDESILVI